MDGTWERLLTHVVALAEATGAVEWIVSVDSTAARAYQHAAGACRKGAVLPRSRPWWSRAKGSVALEVGSAAKSIWPPTGAVCRCARCSPGQAGDDPQRLPVLEGIRVPRLGPGRPRTRPEALYRGRNVIERCINRLKRFRDPTTRVRLAPPTTAPS